MQTMTYHSPRLPHDTARLRSTRAHLELGHGRTLHLWVQVHWPARRINVVCQRKRIADPWSLLGCPLKIIRTRGRLLPLHTVDPMVNTTPETCDRTRSGTMPSKSDRASIAVRQKERITMPRTDLSDHLQSSTSGRMRVSPCTHFKHHRQWHTKEDQDLLSGPIKCRICDVRIRMLTPPR